MPTISTVSPVLTTPCSMRPVATVPRPVIEKTSSTGIRNGLSRSRVGLRDVGVQRVGELDDLLLVLLVALERLQRRARDERDVVAREVVLGEQVADLDLDELEELLVVDHVGLVEEHDDVRHADLAGEQDVLTRLRHRAVGRRDHEDRAVHLRGARDHVLHVVGVTGTVDVRVVAGLGLVLDVRGRDRDAALLLLRSVVDLLEALGLAAHLLGEHRRDGRGQRRLAVVDVTDGADVDVRLVALELLLRHFLFAPVLKSLEGGVPGEPGKAIADPVPASAGGARPRIRPRRLRCGPRRSSPRCSAGPRRSCRTASCTWRGPACWSAGRSRSRTSPTAAPCR